MVEPSVVERGERFTLRVDGQPFYPIGWTTLGSCPDEPDTVAWSTVVEQMEVLRGQGMNTILEPGSTNGRFLPRRVGGQYLWQNYAYTDADGRRAQRGHPRPGAYVAGLHRLMDLAYFGREGDAALPIYTIVSLPRFIVPEGQSEAISGAEELSCSAYAQTIEDERATYREAGLGWIAAMPPVACDEAETLPYWEWHLRYIVQSIRDHPGLLAWYLWDEPEGNGKRHLFGIVPPNQSVPRYTGPGSLPTPDLLRYAYDRVVAFETANRTASYLRHPIIVDVYDPDVFFSDRFPWSRDGALRPQHHAGPFDRTPDGTYRTPADILGIDASGTLMQTAARGGEPAHGWYWDPNIPSRKTELLREAVERDDLWSALIVAGQGQLSSKAPFALPESVPCPNPKPRLRLLNDRDLVWHLLTLQMNGMRGHLYYSRSYAPTAGAGAEQIARTDRLTAQFLATGFDRIFRSPRVTEGWALTAVSIEALTNYFRSDPMFTGPADDYDPGRSAFSRDMQLTDPTAYRVSNFGRSAGRAAYGHPTTEPRGEMMHENHELLRRVLHRVGDAYYLFVSNVYDARIAATFRFDDYMPSGTNVSEGQFNLDPDGRFAWTEALPRTEMLTAPGLSTTFRVELEPYEARVFRILPAER